jgi:hypothetical protein
MAKGKPQAPAFEVGDVVNFLGYSEEVPEEDQNLVVGQSYTVVDIDTENESVIVEIDNPEFNPKKKESEDNSRTLQVDVFFDEVAIAADDEPEEAPKAKAKPAAAKAATKPAAKPTAKAKRAAPEEDDEDTAEGEPEEEPEEAPKAKPVKATAKPAAKATTKPAAKGKTTTKAAVKSKGKAKAAPAEKEEVDPYPALAEEDGEILELIEGVDGEELIELAREVAEDSAAVDYKLGGILYHLRLGKAYQEAGKEYTEKGGFGLFIKDKLNIEYRKAMYLIDIYYKFNLFGIDAEKVRELGWTKCSRIASVMTEHNADELIELAEESTLADLSDTIKETYSKTSVATGEKRKKITFKFRLWEDQADAVKGILEGVTEQMGFKDPAEAFEHIVVEWAAEHYEPAKKSKAKTRAAATGKATAQARA